MDRTKLEDEISRCEEKLAEVQIGTKEYNDVVETLIKLYAMRNDMAKTENERLRQNREQDYREDELATRRYEIDQKIKAQKRSDGVGAVKGVLVALVCAGLALFTDEVKEKQGFLDKNKLDWLKEEFRLFKH